MAKALAKVISSARKDGTFIWEIRIKRGRFIYHWEVIHYHRNFAKASGWARTESGAERKARYAIDSIEDWGSLR